jgi:uncharacterized protein YjlB
MNYIGPEIHERKMPELKAIELDYRQVNAANSLLPTPSILSSTDWSQLHLEVFQQPKYEVAEHQHTMHVIAHLPVSARFPAFSTGERWLDGKVCYETRHQGEIAIVPAGVAHRCNWNTSVEFTVLAIEPVMLQQVGQDIVDGDSIELIPRFMNQTYPLIQGIFSTLRDKDEVESARAMALRALEDWFAMLPALTAPAYFFLGEADPFIPLEQVNQIETRLQKLSKIYTLKVYPDADHGFFCNERSNYNQSAAEDA